MGKVIKGSTESEERYTVAIPAPGVAAPAKSLAVDPRVDLNDPIAAYVEEPAAPPEPVIDFDALHAQAEAIISDAERSAQELVEEGQQRARQTLDAAEARATALAEDARRHGYDEGHAAGVAAAQAEMANMLAALRELVESARVERHALLISAEPELVRLAVGIAERVLHQQIALDGGVVVEMARAAIARLVDREKITIRVNPADIERMREHREELLALGDVKVMRVIEDQRVDRGGVVLETDAGSIDAKISTQLGEVRKLLHIVDDVVVVPGSSVAGAGDDDEAPYNAARAS